MAATRTEVRVRRVVVALDAQCENRGALAAGTEIARRWRCALQGVFVVDADLVHLGDLPGVRHVTLSAAGCGPLDPADLAANLAGLEARARRAFAEAARSAGLPASFAVARGGLAAGAVDLAEDDLLVVEAAMIPFAGEVRLESRWRRHAATARQPVLLLRRGQASRGTIAVLDDGNPAADRALALAARLASDDDVPLAILLAAEADGPRAEALARAYPGAAIRRVDAGEGAWPQAIAVAAPSLIVAPADGPSERWAGTRADLLLVP